MASKGMSMASTTCYRHKLRDSGLDGGPLGASKQKESGSLSASRKAVVDGSGVTLFAGR